jgi:hypothetical protein
MKPSRKKRRIGKWAPYPAENVPPLERARQCLERAHHVLAVPVRYQPEEWLLLAGLVGQADSLIREARATDPSASVPLFPVVMDEFRDATANFTNVDFLRSSAPARRDYRDFYKGLIG